MPTINETVDQQLAQLGMRNYSGQARPVVDALVEREQSITEGVIAAAVDQGMGEDEIRDLLTDLGAHVAPTPTSSGSDSGSDSDLAAQVSSLTSTVRDLVEFARSRAGFRG